MNNKKLGFTLAEVLITLGIIGIVAALTIPTLISNYKKKQYVEGLKVAFSILQNGVRKAMSDDGVEDFRDTELYQACLKGGSAVYDASTCHPMMSKYFKIVKFIEEEDKPTDYIDCSNVGKYHLVAYRLGDKSRCFTSPKQNSIYVLENGMSFSSNMGTFIYLDINGLKGPNIVGRDVFLLNFIHIQGSLVGAKSSRFFYLVNAHKTSEEIKAEQLKGCDPKNKTSNGTGCSGRIIDNGWIMDY